MNKKEKMYRVAAQIAVKYGGQINSIYTDRSICEFWDGDDYPSQYHLRKQTDIPTLKWYIRNKIKHSDEVWNSDFLQGLTTNGQIKWNERSFPTFLWHGNKKLIELLKSSPFGGKFNENALGVKNGPDKRWYHVPALYLPYDPESMSFMAGVMASGEKIKVGGNIYIKYNTSQLPYFEQWGIPIAYKRVRRFTISPIWPSLLSLYMPDKYIQYFITPKAYMAEMYAPVLWRMYLKKGFVSKGIPYLKSRRQTYYDHKCEEGVSRRLEMLRIELGLVALDDRIKKAIRKWSKIV